MQRTPLLAIGIVLVLLGAVALFWQKISVTTHETVVDVGPVKVTADKQKDVPISPILGGVAVVGGLVLVVAGARKP